MEYALVTMHRPANVDNQEKLKHICESLDHISQSLPLIFPVHPRTRKNLEQGKLWSRLEQAPNIHLEDAVPYIRFMSLVFNSRLLITDSDGVQEETTYLGIPCLTLRPNTERPITIECGTNRLCSIHTLQEEVTNCLESECSELEKIDLWDGETSSRIVKYIKEIFYQ